MKVAQEIDVDGVTIIINPQNKLEAKIPPSTTGSVEIEELTGILNATITSNSQEYPVTKVGRVKGTNWLVFQADGMFNTTTTPPEEDLSYLGGSINTAEDLFTINGPDYPDGPIKVGAEWVGGENSILTLGVGKAAQFAPDSASTVRITFDTGRTLTTTYGSGSWNFTFKDIGVPEDSTINVTKIVFDGNGKEFTTGLGNLNHSVMDAPE